MSHIRSFEEAAKYAQGKLVSVPQSLPLRYTDFFVRMVHELGAFTVGPVKSDDVWVQQMFGYPRVNVPKAGIGFDIDSCAVGVSLRTADDYKNCLRTVFEATLATEKALGDYLGLLNG
jgi:hypothetical protein